MACASVSVEPSVTECAVCHEDLTEPKILPCAHLLCKACLLSWLQAHPDPHCPLCRCAIVESSQTRSPEDVAEHLPSDLNMAALVASTRTLREKHVCCVCDDVTATSVCLDCEDMFCPSCTKLHQKQSATRHHCVEDLSTMTAERLTASRRPPCVAHTNEPSSLCCSTHGVTVCLLCAMAKHRACPEVQELQDRVSEARVLLGELAATLKAGEAELEKAVSELDRHMLETERRADTALADIDAACDRLQKAVEACRCRLKELTFKAKDDVRTAVNFGKTVLLARRGKLTSHRRLVELAQQTAPPACIDEVKATLHARVKELDCSTKLSAGCPIINELTLIMNETQLSKFENEIKKLGAVSVEPVEQLQLDYEIKPAKQLQHYEFEPAEHLQLDYEFEPAEQLQLDYEIEPAEQLQLDYEFEPSEQLQLDYEAVHDEPAEQLRSTMRRREIKMKLRRLLVPRDIQTIAKKNITK